MVDALRSVQRVLRPGALLVDTRPSTSRVPRLERGGRVIARLAPMDHTRHRRADEAIASFVTSGRLVPLRSGTFWYRHTFRDRAAVEAWFAERDDWDLAGPLPRGRLTLRRAIEFTHYRRV